MNKKCFNGALLALGFGILTIPAALPLLMERNVADKLKDEPSASVKTKAAKQAASEGTKAHPEMTASEKSLRETVCVYVLTRDVYPKDILHGDDIKAVRVPKSASRSTDIKDRTYVDGFSVLRTLRRGEIIQTADVTNTYCEIPRSPDASPEAAAPAASSDKRDSGVASAKAQAKPYVGVEQLQECFDLVAVAKVPIQAGSSFGRDNLSFVKMKKAPGDSVIEKDDLSLIRARGDIAEGEIITFRNTALYVRALAARHDIPAGRLLAENDFSVEKLFQGDHRLTASVGGKGWHPDFAVRYLDRPIKAGEILTCDNLK